MILYKKIKELNIENFDNNKSFKKKYLFLYIINFKIIKYI